MMARAGDDVAFGLENRGVPAGGDLAAGGRGAAPGRLPLRAGPAAPPRCPAASSNGSRWPARWRCGRTCCCSTSRPPTSTRPAPPWSGAALAARWTTGTPRWSWSSTGSPRRCRWSTGSWCSTRAAASAPTARPRRSSPRTATRWPAAGVWVPGRPIAPRRATAAPRGELLVARPVRRCHPGWAATDLAVRGGRGAGRPRPQRRRQVHARAAARRPAAARLGAGHGVRARWPATDAAPPAAPVAGGRAGPPDRLGVPGPGAPVRHRHRCSTSWRWGRAGSVVRRSVVDCGRLLDRLRLAQLAARQPVHPLRRRGAAAERGHGAGHRAAPAGAGRAHLRPGPAHLAGAGRPARRPARRRPRRGRRHPRRRLRRRPRRPPSPCDACRPVADQRRADRRARTRRWPGATRWPSSPPRLLFTCGRCSPPSTR